MSKKSKIAVYVRVSTLDQAKGMASQEHAIESYLEGHGLEAQWFKDRLSGKDLKRPQFEKLQKAIFDGKVDTVVVWKLDRLSRNQRDGINLLANWMEQGIRVIAVAQQIDLQSSTGKLISSLLFGLAELERETLRENTKRGLQAARKRGVKLGRPVALKAKQVRPLLAKGLSVNAIAKKLRCSRTAVQTCMKQHGLKRPKQVAVTT